MPETISGTEQPGGGERAGLAAAAATSCRAPATMPETRTTYSRQDENSFLASSESKDAGASCL